MGSLSAFKPTDIILFIAIAMREILQGCTLRRFLFLPVFLIILVSTFLVYQPGLTGSFIFDDYPNIVNNTNLTPQNLDVTSLRHAALSSTSGPLRRPVSMLTFAFDYYANGFNPFYFKLTNLAIHLINGIGIFLLSCALLSAYRKKFEPSLSQVNCTWITLAATAAWMLHPFNLTSVLYVVQRMNSLSTLFVLYGLALYTWGRIRLIEDGKGIIAILVSLLLFTPLAALCKENGALLPFFALVIEMVFFKFQAKKQVARHLLTGLYIVVAAVPAIAALAFVATHPSWLLDAYKGRDFTLWERILTEARILWFYLRLIVLPSIPAMGLFHDDIANSHGLFSPITTVFSLIGLAALVGVSWTSRRKAPLLTFAILFYLIGHTLESTVFPFEITFEHRNYLPMYGIMLAMFFYLLYPLKYVKHLFLRGISAVLLIILFAFGTYQRAEAWSNPIGFAYSEVSHHPDSARNNLEMGNMYAQLAEVDGVDKAQYKLLAYQYLQRATDLDPNYTGGLFSLIMLKSSDGTFDTQQINELKRRLMQSPVTGTVGNNLIKLLTCVSKGQCHISNAELESLLQAALKNPSVTGSTRSAVLSAMSLYLVNFAKDYPAALDVMHQTIDNAPQELEYRLSLVKFLGALGRYEEAKSQLAILERMDSLKEYSAQISAQEKKFAESKNNTQR